VRGGVTLADAGMDRRRHRLHHLQGWLQEAKIFHIVFTLGNAIALLWGAACLLLSRSD
jgi:hypothetical protein